MSDAKTYILTELTQRCSVSGAALSETLGISRTAVWKYILKLREEGWNIEAAPRAGYRLDGGADALMPYMLYDGLNTRRFGRIIEYHAEIDSTNIRARRWAQEGAPDGALVIAQTQTAGRGRLTRRWESPAGMGIYMSLIYKPQLPMQRLSRIVPVAPLGVCRGLKPFLGDGVQIKWPNDIVRGGRKICGMLMEVQAGQDGIDWLVMGMGINAHQTMDDFPEGVRDTASSVDALSGRFNARAEIVRSVLTELERCADMFKAGDDAELMAEYAACSATLNRRVRVIGQTSEYEADAVALNEDGALIVRRDDGSTNAVYAGDVSVRGLMGYV